MFAGLERKHAIDLKIQSNWGYATYYEQICLYLFKNHPNSVREFLFSTAKDFDKTSDLSYLMEVAKTVLSPSKYKLLEANINLSAIIPLVEYEKKSEEIYYIEGNPMEVIELNLSNKNSVDSVVQQLKMNKDIKITLKLNAAPQNYQQSLKGYGFEMRPFKYSMEYDIKDSSSEQGEQSYVNIDDETLEDLMDFPQTTINLSAIDTNLKLLSYLAKNDEKSAFKVLRDITNNWPAFSETILNTDTNNQISQLMTIMNNILSPYLTTTSINGRIVSIDNLDIFTVLEVLQQEESFREVLSDYFNLSKIEIDQISKKPLAQQTTYLDYRSDTIDYVNDIEHDNHYKESPDTMEELEKDYPIPFVRRNLLNLILFIDPSTVDGFTRYMSAYQLVTHGYHVRLGIAPIFNFRNRLSRRFAFAYSHMALKDPMLAANFLSIIPQFTMIDKRGVPTRYDEKVIADAYNAVAAARGLDDWATIHKYMDPSSEEFKRLKTSQERLRKLAVKINTCAINGRIEEAPESSAQYFYLAKTEANEVRRVVNLLGELPDDIIEAYKQVNTVIDTLTSPLMETGPVEGLGMIKKNAVEQIKLVEQIEGMEYFKTDKNATVSYILYTGGNKDIPAFKEFANSNHQTPSKFAINPTAKIISIQENDYPVLIAGGRVYRKIHISVDKLKMIDNSISCTTMSHIISSAPVHPSSALCDYLSAVFVDWQANFIERAESNVDVIALGEPLVYTSGDADITWEIIASPSSMEFQRIIDTVKYVADHNIMNVTLILNANTPLDPQRNVFDCFYRKVLESEEAVFSVFDPATTYSIIPDVPQTWFIESLTADLDLDNIVVGEQSPGIYNASYALFSLAVEGNAFRSIFDTAAGADLRLDASQTMVMKAEGYFQLRGLPGRHILELSPGRTSSVLEPIHIPIDIDTFATRPRCVFLRPKPGHEQSSLYPEPAPQSANESHVDVFVVASGALYERLTKIMMLSVIRNSERPVKFWLLRNSLSPDYKSSLADMARENHFEYEFVDYKWPQWLRPQSEKNRIVWANKILFLDEIFPMNLRRVIYVDADQIVRADLGELMDMDFHGAPYAFTPFCTENARNETRMFRFWEDGYWKNHLRNHKYHISALFAVDLERFRQMGAGDKLRMYYNTLSSDPNSLSNLDQDLPNYVQLEIPIFSLPQEWLWCETWCTDESLPRAKTVDLCNNPLTHVGKLDIARTMVKEWPGLDEEARAIKPTRAYMPEGW